MAVDDRHMARVYLAQARNFRRHRGFHATLLDWAAKRRAMASAISLPGQGDLFGGCSQ